MERSVTRCIKVVDQGGHQLVWLLSLHRLLLDIALHIHPILPTQLIERCLRLRTILCS